MAMLVARFLVCRQNLIFFLFIFRIFGIHPISVNRQINSHFLFVHAYLISLIEYYSLYYSSFSHTQVLDIVKID